MKNTSQKKGLSAKLIALMLCVSSLTAVVGVTGCSSTSSSYKQSPIDDHGLSVMVKGALDEDNQAGYAAVNVSAINGVVQLNGFVNTVDQKSRAGHIAQNIAGIVKVENSIVVN